MKFQNLSTFLDSLVSNRNTPGYECIVMQKHNVIFHSMGGYSNIESGKKINGSELYYIFSMTKMLTCTCALQLIEQGKFDINDKVSDYLPEFSNMYIAESVLDMDEAKNITTGRKINNCQNKISEQYATKPITIKHLFTMSAGLDYNLSTPYITEVLNRGVSDTRTVVSCISKSILGFEPGTRFRYSLCHDVLGALIEVVSGKKFGEYMQENLIKPLGLKDTFFETQTNGHDLKRMASLYDKNADGTFEKLPLTNCFCLGKDYESGGAGLISNTKDYSIFLDALACGGVSKNGVRILTNQSIQLMKTNQMIGKQKSDFDELRKGYGYGLGVRTHIDPNRSGSISPIGEFGWDGAAGGFSMVDTEHALSLTYFQHCESWNLDTQIKMRNALYSDFRRL